MKNNTLFEKIENLNELLKSHPKITDNAIYSHVFFDKENELYFSTLHEIKDSNTRAHWGYTKKDHPKVLKVYSYNLLKNKLSDNKFNIFSKNKPYAVQMVAHMIFNVETYYNEFNKTYTKEMDVNIINTIFEEYSRKGIGTNMMDLLSFYAVVEDVNEIRLSVYPFSYTKDKPESIKAFYERKNNFEISESEISKEFSTAVKKLTDEHKNNIKERIINFPTQDKNYTVLLPESYIISSSFKGKEK